uniref:Nuclear nucleic acid-binding protein C1D n=1 Tax=Peronospora matthiolae TaxID=2874970 RepID=A0AAV1TEW5_9STRA
MNKQVPEVFASVEQTLAAAEEHLAVFSKTSVEEFVAPLSYLERAKVQVSLAYTINALLFVFLKTQGVSPSDIRQTHVKQELERVKTFINKIKDAEELAKGPRMALDKGASKRFIHNALSTDQVYVDAVKAKENVQDGVKVHVQTIGNGNRAASASKSKKNKRQRKK